MERELSLPWWSFVCVFVYFNLFLLFQCLITSDMLASTAGLYRLQLQFGLTDKTLEKWRADGLGAVSLHGNKVPSGF